MATALIEPLAWEPPYATSVALKNKTKKKTKKKEEKSQTNSLIYHPKELEKEEQTKPEVSRRKEIIKIREEINKVEIKKKIEKISKTKSWFFERVNKIGRPLPDSPRGGEKKNK